MLNTINWSRTILTMAATLVVATAAIAQPPMPSPTDADYRASGFVTPAGMPPIGGPGGGPMMYSAQQGLPPGGVVHAGGMAMPGPGPGGMGMPGPGGAVMPVGFMGGRGAECDSCDCLGYGCNRCGGGAVGSRLRGGHGGILERLHRGESACGCGGNCGGSGLLGCGHGGCARKLLGGCGLFGRCGYCQQLGIGRGGLHACLMRLLPYSEGGQCAQRWYDVSAEALFLGRNGNGGSSDTVTTLGIAGPEVLSIDDAGLSDLEAGIRLSGAMILGAGGNVELTYMGSNRWEGVAAVTSPTPDLYSFLSEFGTNPAGGFDDSDRSVRQAVAGEANFHSGELNYRRRTVTPSCKYQFSWLGGLRYLRFDDSLRFEADGLVNNGGVIATQRFLDLTTETKNDLFGVQVGGDLWWNVVAGVNLGCELKVGVLDNEVDRTVFATGNSLGPGATPGSRSSELGRSETTGMIDFSTTIIYRVSHSWALRSSYYMLAVDEVASGFDSSLSQALLQTPQVNSTEDIRYGSMVLSGVTFGAEYTW